MEGKACIARSYLEKVLVDEAAEPKALPLSLLEDITGNFSHDQEIGSGGFAVVYKGILGDKEIAVKKLSDGLMEDAEFDREIECLMRTKHKNVVRFLGYCDNTQRSREKYDGKPVMAEIHQRLLCFEYIPNGSLDEYIKDAYREWGICYKIIKDICEGVQYLHDNNIIHLDLKPANILLDNNMVPKITDFGLSRCLAENESRHITKTISGTLGYFAPEWHERGEITRRADLYSLGVILLEILTGQRGHQNSTDVLKSWSDRSQDTQLKEIQVCYEIALECKDLNPEKRPASARDIIVRLHEMESIQAAVAASESKGKRKDERHLHPLAGQTDVMPCPYAYHEPQDDGQEALAAIPSDPVASTSRAPAAESDGKSKDEPCVSASSEPRHATLVQGMAAPHPSPYISAFNLVDTKPPLPARLGRRGAAMAATRMASTYDMVEPMSYLYVSVVKARDLPTGSLHPYVEVKVGHLKGVTRHLEKNHNPNPVWRQTFAFSGAHHLARARQLEVIVKDDMDTLRDDFVGRVVLDMSDMPSRVPPDSPLAPQWYTLSDSHGYQLWHGHALGQILLAVWLGTQADDAFPESWQSDAHPPSTDTLTNTRSKVYYSPKLIYLKISVIEAQDLITADKGRPLAPTIAKIQMGSQIRRTRPGQPHGSANQAWNEEFMFVASETFEDPLVVTVEEKVAAGRNIIPVLSLYVPRSDLDKSVPSKWFTLSRGMTVDEAAAHATMGIIHVTSPHVRRRSYYLSRWLRWVHSVATWKWSSLSVDEAPVDVTVADTRTFDTKIHLRMSLATAYNVPEESMHYSTDLQPAVEKLRKSAIGVLEVGILGARNLGNNKYPYCVAKYGVKWIRTRTLLRTAGPRWNEPYSWEVLDLSTVITIAVFNNNHLFEHRDGPVKDRRIGKVRVPLATLESNRVYAHYYPLMVLSSMGLKKTGELHLAIRFTCKTWANMLAQYGGPLLPTMHMHYTNPISEVQLQLDCLRVQVMQMVATRLGRADPPLHREVVEYMLDVDSHMFSLRRSKANFNRITSLFSGVVAVAEWFDGICKWRNPLITILVHVLYLIPVCYPELILPTVFLYLFMIGVWNYRRRPRKPPHMDTVLSRVLQADPDELDEEFDTFPTSKPDDIVRMRYDRLRSVACKVQTVVGDLATQGERAHSLLSWRDPRATAIFITLSLLVAVVLYITRFQFQVVAVVPGLYMLRHPRFRSKQPSMLFNFYKRLPAKGDMPAVSLGTQCDETFPEAWHSISPEELTNTRSQVYYSPKLIYLKISVIEAEDLIAADNGRPLAPTVAKIQMGSQIRRTRPGQPHGSANQAWNEEFMFVACEPFDDFLVVTVEEKVADGRDDPIGHIIIPVASSLPYVPRNDLAKSVPSKWFNLSRVMTVDEATTDATTADASKIHLKMSLETAYHVLDESTHYSSDLQPAAKKLRKSAIGVLQVDILSARGLGGSKNPYCVAKYGSKWVRTRTLLGTAAPAWNEQYTWEVFDLSTVITVAVFDNNHVHHSEGAKDQRIGKVRVRLATLESDRVYTHYYPLMALSPGGLKKTGELHLAVRFTCTAWANMLAQYGRPLLPKMHYSNPISVLQLDYLRFQAMQMVATRLGRSEPPLHREVVEYMLDVDSHMFSMRRSKANFYRITSLRGGKWFDDICKWKNPLKTILVHVLFLILVCYPELILPTVFLYLFMIGVWNYWRRPRKLPHMDTVLSHAEQVHPDELDEEFDTFPTSKPDDIVRMRYDRLRSVAGRVQTVVGDLATQGERAQSLLSWRDPRATAIFITLSLFVAVVLYITPFQFQIVAVVPGLYMLRHPRFRSKQPFVLFNFYNRLPAKGDMLL